MDTGGAFGPKKSGKSTLAHKISQEHWQKLKMKSLILDPHTDEWNLWPKESVGFITADESQFWQVVWGSTSCLVIVEEAAQSISRNKKLIPVFTRLRHNHHKLFVIGHSGMDLLPVMREQFDTLYLFRQPESAAKVWAEVMTQRGLLEAVHLKQYEFLYNRLFLDKPVKLKLKL